MTADVEFISKSLNNAIYVPIESVNEKDGSTFVFVKNGSDYKRTTVKTGISNDNFVCITKGLKKGQVVALRDPNKPLDEQPQGNVSKDKEPAPVPGSEKN